MMSDSEEGPSGAKPPSQAENGTGEAEADAERAPPLPIQEEFSSDEETVIEDVTSEDRGPEKDMPTSNQEEILSDEKTSPSLVTNGNNPETDT
ncbi:UNVERIFIED_CONTAM: hypothetical protein FKN15_016023 [Acipenser sinensis]